MLRNGSSVEAKLEVARNAERVKSQRRDSVLQMCYRARHSPVPNAERIMLDEPRRLQAARVWQIA
jgi:hypothetical protein